MYIAWVLRYNYILNFKLLQEGRTLETNDDINIESSISDTLFELAAQIGAEVKIH